MINKLYTVEITKELADKIGCVYSDDMPPMCCAYLQDNEVCHVEMCIDISDGVYKMFIPIPDSFEDQNGQTINVSKETEDELNKYIYQQIQNIKEFDINNLKTLSIKDIVIDNNSHMDRVFTKLILDDYDWMNYQLDVQIPTAFDIINISFRYYGCVTSTMHLKYKDMERDIDFDADIFIKHLNIYMQHHMQQWNSEDKAFYGEKEVLDFYNEVINTL